jgi:hypothetical protein
MDMSPSDARLLHLAAHLCAQGAEGRAGIGALLRDIERRFPGEIERMSAAIQLDRLGVRRPRLDH